MSVVSNISIENVRCLRSLPNLPIRSITLLVGENNAGKTTFLGCYQALRKLMDGYPGPASRDVFEYTALSTRLFCQIASSKRGIRHFSLGARLNEQGWACNVGYRFAEANGAPSIAAVSYDFGKDQQLTLQFEPPDAQSPSISGPGFVIEAEKSSNVGLHNLSMKHVVWHLESLASLAGKKAISAQ